MTTDLDGFAPAVARAIESARRDSGPAVAVNGVDEPTAHGDIWDGEVAEFDAAARGELARSALRQAASAGAEVAGMFGRAVTETAVATSAGRRRYAAATEVTGSLTARIEDGSSHWVDLDRRLAAVDIRSAIAATMATAARTTGRRPLADGNHDVVLGPIAVGGMLESLASFGFTGSSLAAGIGAAATRRGEQVAAPVITIADDAGWSRGLPFPFDMEGTDRARVPLIDAGRVGDAVTDLRTASPLGRASTGHAHVAREESPEPVPANLVLEPGTDSIAELVAGVEHGVFIERFWYLRVVDPARTTLTGVSRDAAWLIEHGRLTVPVAGARWTENVFDVLSRADGVSAEVAAQPLSNIWNGCVTAPALRVRGFRFGAAPSPSRPEGTS